MENSAEISNSFNHNFIKNMDISQLTDFIISTNRLGLENYCKIGKQLFMDILNQDSIDDIRKGFKMT